MQTSTFSNAIAITGGIASGKSTVCNLLKLYGYSIIDTDSIAHKILESSKDEVINAFGSDILESNANISRKKLGEIVFKNKAKLAMLESILHPKIRSEVTQKAQILESQQILYFIDIPLFFELKARNNGYEIPRVLLIYAPKELQLERLQKRDNLNAESAISRLDNQMDIEIKKQNATFIIENTSDIDELQKQVEKFLKSLRS